MSKAELLANLREENDQWEALLAQIGEARMDQPGVAGEWSIKDIVAHITAWRRRTVARLEAAARGESDPPPPWPAHLKETATDEEINAWFHEADRNRSLREVLDDSRQVFQQMAGAIEAFSEAGLSDPKRMPWLEGNPLTARELFSHFHDEHEADMRAWLEKLDTR